MSFLGPITQIRETPVLQLKCKQQLSNVTVIYADLGKPIDDDNRVVVNIFNVPEKTYLPKSCQSRHGHVTIYPHHLSLY